jgi:hypothetical protein
MEKETERQMEKDRKIKRRWDISILKRKIQKGNEERRKGRKRHREMQLS